ncbi:hypothetical protein GW764_01815 [Candidatus Parcubacteria bacterium]|nr:hypothetical protein [Candidatus Parcubacteria bacterium]
MKNKIKKLIENKKGFTIVESLFAIFILVISVTGPMAFTQSGLRASFIARDQVTAFYLAQDAIEYIKNVRDSNSIKSIGGTDTFWLNSLSDCYDGSECTIDTIDEVILSCGTITNNPGCFDDNNLYPLKIDDDGFFRITEGTKDSIFAREIKITPVPSGELIGDVSEVQIEVIVKWQTPQSIGDKSINVKENMFNWATGI